MIEELLKNKALKPKQKTAIICQQLLDGELGTAILIKIARTAKDPVKATCIEALTLASETAPELITAAVFDYMCESLSEKAPRIKWESARAIANSAHLHTARLGKAIAPLLDNTEHTGTVVRWSAATALGEILKLNTPHNKTLKPAAEAICEREEKNSIRKIYLVAFKKLKG